MVAVVSFIQIPSSPLGSMRVLLHSCGALLLGFGLVASLSFDSSVQVDAHVAAPYRNLAADASFNMVEDAAEEWSLEELTNNAFDFSSSGSDTADSSKIHRETPDDLPPSAYRSSWIPFREVDVEPDTTYFNIQDDQHTQEQAESEATEGISDEYYDAIGMLDAHGSA
eukprot:GHVT01064831.1.p1 GENE.GHVT01064831.1~~GHVT01064831.1.p1  ORF type:complete len:168 (+),score=23.87 GHVT01064831.1:255-758(+)